MQQLLVASHCHIVGDLKIIDLFELLILFYQIYRYCYTRFQFLMDFSI